MIAEKAKEKMSNDASEDKVLEETFQGYHLKEMMQVTGSLKTRIISLLQIIKVHFLKSLNIVL